MVCHSEMVSHSNQPNRCPVGIAAAAQGGGGHQWREDVWIAVHC